MNANIITLADDTALVCVGIDEESPTICLPRDGDSRSKELTPPRGEPSSRTDVDI